jgi:hypothetical protein
MCSCAKTTAPVVGIKVCSGQNGHWSCTVPPILCNKVAAPLAFHEATPSTRKWNSLNRGLLFCMSMRMTAKKRYFFKIIMSNFK